MGVDRQESSSRTKATSSRMVRGVAGLSNMVRGRVRTGTPSKRLSQARCKRVRSRLVDRARM